VEKESLEDFQKVRNKREVSFTWENGRCRRSKKSKEKCKKVKMQKTDKVTDIMVAVKKDTAEVKKDISTVGLRLKEITGEWNKKQ
jgi:gas vesicle protein